MKTIETQTLADDHAMKVARLNWILVAPAIGVPDAPMLTEILFRVCGNDPARFELITEHLDAAYAAGWEAGRKSAQT